MYYTTKATLEREANERTRRRALLKSDPMWLPPPTHKRPKRLKGRTRFIRTIDKSKKNNTRSSR